MTNASNTLVAASSRRLSVRARPDLIATRQTYQGTTYWIVKEPVGLKYFRFHDEEYFLLQLLGQSPDGEPGPGPSRETPQSLDDIKRAYELQFAPSHITTEEIARFFGTLYQSGLVIADVPGQGEQLQTRHQEKRRQETLSALGNILAVRFKGIDPDRLLSSMYPAVRWFFSPWGVAAAIMLALSALLLVAVQWEVFIAKLPTFQEFFQARNWIWLAVALAGTKIIHEFGHGLTCKHFGGECHEMGLMLLVLTPCLYCNVSDSWMLPSKWRRAAIGAAGMYIEIVLASLCTFLWWFTHPGLFNQLCLSVVFVSSVSTILFNANPLLRYDGYYILSDLVEIPNLRQKASAILNRKMGSWFLGLPAADDPFLPQRQQWFFALYSVAAAVYRWVVVGSILWFLYKMFEPYGLQIIGQLIALFAMYGLVLQPLIRLAKFFYVPGRLQKVKRPRLYASLAAVSAVLLAVAVVPLPHSVICSLELRPFDASQVFVDVPGSLEEVFVKEGDYVEAGQELGRLRSLDVQLAVMRLQGNQQRQQDRLDSLRRNRHRRDEIGREANQAIPAAMETLASLNSQLKQKKQEAKKLRLVAPRAGHVMLPPIKTAGYQESASLPTWSGTPLDARNQGTYLRASERFCQIGDPRALEAILVIDQADIEFVAKGQRVEVNLDLLAAESFESTVENIARVELDASPTRLSSKAGGELTTLTDEQGQERLMNTSYQARVLLRDEEGILHAGLRGRAKIRTEPQTLATRLYRSLRQTFNFSL